MYQKLAAMIWEWAVPHCCEATVFLIMLRNKFLKKDD